MRKNLGLFCFWVLLTSNVKAGVILINEFSPNPLGKDPTTQAIELMGPEHQVINDLTFMSVESDASGNVGVIDFIQRNISIQFNSFGIGLLDIPDLENPSFTLLLGIGGDFTLGQDIDLDNDGFWDLPWHGHLDSIGIFDSKKDDSSVNYAEQLGGVDFEFTGTEPFLTFRDNTDLSWYALNSMAEGLVYNSFGETVASTQFDNLASVPTFGTSNPSRVLEVPEPKVIIFWLILWFIWFLRR